MTHVVFNDDGEFLIKKKKRRGEKRSFLQRRSRCEFEIDPSGKQRKRHRNFLVPRKNFWTNIRLTRPKYLGNYSHRKSLVRACKRNPISNHFRREYYGKERRRKKNHYWNFWHWKIPDFENISRSQLRKIDLIRMHTYIRRIKVSRVIFPFLFTRMQITSSLRYRC